MQTESRLLQAARSHSRAGRSAAATAVYRRIIEDEPQFKAEALHALGLIAFGEGRDDDALDLLAKAIDADRNVALYYANFSRALEKVGHFSGAISAAGQAVALGGGSPELIERLCNLFLAADQLDKALSTAAEFDSNPALAAMVEADPMQRMARVRVRRLFGDHGGARADLLRVLIVEPGLPAAWHQFGRIERAAGADARAIVCYGRALSAVRDLEVVYDQGIALQRVGRLDEAQSAFNETTAKFGYTLSRGADLKATGLAELDISPDQAEGVRRRGHEAEHAGRPIEAVTLFALASSLSPRDEKPRQDLERLLARLGKRRVLFHRLVHSALGMAVIEMDLFHRKIQLGQVPDDTLVVFLSGISPSNRSVTAMAARLMPFVVDDRIYYSMLEVMLPIFRLPESWLWGAEYEDYTNPEIKSGWVFTPEERERGREGMKRLGLDPDKDWYVAIFARDNGWAVKNLSGMPETYTHFRNADINSYHEAIQLILDRGGTVVRMGAVPERALTFKHPKVIDYATLGREDFMDVFLVAHARFFMGTPAGILDVARVFDTPTLHVNFAIGWAHPGKKVLHLPKRLVRRATGEPVPFAEYLAHYSEPDPVGAVFSDAGLARNGYAYIDNTPEELREAAEEMFELLEGRWAQDPADRELLDRYFALFENAAHRVVSEPARARLPVVLAHLRRYRSWYFPDG